MKVNLAYGETGLELRLPDNAHILKAAPLHGLANEKQAVIRALRQPIGTEPLRDKVKSGDRVAIVISDITRPTPNHKLVPWILEELAHVPPGQITVINGTGTHRDQTKDELVGMLGREVVDRVNVINHHCKEKEELDYVGESSFGCKVYLNKAYTEADVRIVTGFIEPHFFAGFSGGPKGIMPGIAGLETIQTFHNAQMIGHPLATWGILEGNPLQAMTREVNAMCPPDFLLNVSLNESKEITGVFAGEWTESHRVGCEFVKRHNMIACDKQYDIVITSNAGYPLDQNLYQAVKGMSAAHKIVRKGGVIICAAECRDGMPSHGNYADILKLGETPADILRLIESPGFRMMDQWQVQKQMVILSDAEVYVYSTLPDRLVREAKCQPTDDIEKLIEHLCERWEGIPSIAVLPHGPVEVPYVPI